MPEGEVQLCHLLFSGLKQKQQHGQHEFEVMNTHEDSSSRI